MAEVATLLRQDLPGAEPDPHAADLRLIRSALHDGTLAFFLGAYASLDQSLLGNAFYEELARKFGCPVLAGDRASFVSSRHGYRQLWKKMRKVFASARPSVLHRLIAALPAFLRERGATAPLLILTTNYETSMEHRR